MNRIIVAGCGTGVGKTLVSAILVQALQGAYWKPVECGGKNDSDTATVKRLLPRSCVIHSPAYSLEAPVSPHQAARLEGIEIDLASIRPPESSQPLIIEMAGGVLVPLTQEVLLLDVFADWKADWVVVSQHYLGSINHTLLTIEALIQRNIKVKGIIFNGQPNFDSEKAILNFTKLPCLGRLLPETWMNTQTIKRYAKAWSSTISCLIL